MLPEHHGAAGVVEGRQIMDLQAECVMLSIRALERSLSNTTPRGEVSVEHGHRSVSLGFSPIGHPLRLWAREGTTRNRLPEHP